MEEWEKEPNELKWKHAGLKCWIKRMPDSLHLCGYVGVPKGHILFKIAYGDEVPALTKAWEKRKTQPVGDFQFGRVLPMLGGDEKPTPEYLFDVHGGLTFANHFDADNLWWFGFDCAHSGDMSPGYLDKKYGSCLAQGTYRDISYVKDETEKLAVQIADIKTKATPCDAG